MKTMHKKGVEGLSDLKNIILAIVGFLALLAVFYAIYNSAQAKTQEGGFTHFMCTILSFLPNCETSSTAPSSTLSDLKIQLDRCHEEKNMDCPSGIQTIYQLVVQQGSTLTFAQVCTGDHYENCHTTSKIGNTKIEMDYGINLCDSTSSLPHGGQFILQKNDKAIQVEYHEGSYDSINTESSYASVNGVGYSDETPAYLCIYFNPDIPTVSS